VQVEHDFAFRGDVQQWQQALSNLLKNAIDSLHHTKLHLQPGDLYIDIRTRGKRGRISVLDYGLPISPEVLPHVFEPFYTDGPAAGLGLGLPFCQQLAQQAGGHIAVESDALAGTAVHIYLPIATKTSPSPSPNTHTPAQHAAPQHSKGGK
jgi:signal transduction histidine kinase